MSNMIGVQEMKAIAREFDMQLSEVIFIEFNRTGVWLPERQVPVGFRARFLCDDIFSSKPPVYFAVPVKDKEETKFSVAKNLHLKIDGFSLGKVTVLEIDTCDRSYFRKDKKVLNLNSNRRGGCSGCAYCIHNYPIYDQRVLKDGSRISSKDKIRNFLEKEIMEKNGLCDLSSFEQIAIVTGLFPSEKSTVKHIANVREVASRLRFQGEIFFLGSELRSDHALLELKNYTPFSFCYAVDCFTEREIRLNKRKADHPMLEIPKTLDWARKCGFETTFSCIIGVDPLEDVIKNIKELKRHANRFPIVNIYQIQHPDQRLILAKGADKLNFFLQARMIFESVFSDTSLKPRNWENYRSLWTHWFRREFLRE